MPAVFTIYFWVFCAENILFCFECRCCMSVLVLWIVPLPSRWQHSIFRNWRIFLFVLVWDTCWFCQDEMEKKGLKDLAEAFKVICYACFSDTLCLEAMLTFIYLWILFDWKYILILKCCRIFKTIESMRLHQILFFFFLKAEIRKKIRIH